MHSRYAALIPPCVTSRSLNVFAYVALFRWIVKATSWPKRRSQIFIHKTKTIHVTLTQARLHLYVQATPVVHDASRECCGGDQLSCSTATEQSIVHYVVSAKERFGIWDIMIGQMKLHSCIANESIMPTTIHQYHHLHYDRKCSPSLSISSRC